MSHAASDPLARPAPPPFNGAAKPADARPEDVAPAELPTAQMSAATPRIARIVSVSGAQAVAALDGSPADDSAAPPRLEIGATVTIPTPHSIVLGLVSAMTTPIPDTETDQESVRLIELNLAGEIIVDPVTSRPVFRRGVSSVPSMGDGVHQANQEALRLAYTQPATATIDVGTLYQNSEVPARLLVDDLFGKHFLIVGTTGCGKSSALTGILQSLLPDYQQARVVILDIHNEYAQAFGDRAELIAPSNLNLPFWLLNFQELTAAFTSSDDQHEAEVEILSEAVLWAKRRYMDAPSGRLRRPVDGQVVSIDTPVPFRLADLVSYIDNQLGKLDRTLNTLAYKRLKSRIETLISDPRYSFMFGSLMIEDTMTDVLGRLFRVPVNGKPITVLDLATVPAEILDVVISVISRLAFDLANWSDAQLPILIVCEEAHRYAPADAGNKFMPTRQALSRIAKEGRKYGVSLALITQRPSELDPTILSQCSTVFAMRLSTERDQVVVRANTHEGGLDLLDFLAILGDREAIVLGQGVVMPMRIRFHTLKSRGVAQHSHQGFSNAWKHTTIDRDVLAEIVHRWRSPARAKT